MVVVVACDGWWCIIQSRQITLQIERLVEGEEVLAEGRKEELKTD